MDKEIPFKIRDVVDILNLHIRHKNAASWDIDCPFCGEHKGKLNVNLSKNVYKCNRCGESGGMLALYAKVYGVDNRTAYYEILDILGMGENKTESKFQPREKIVRSTEETKAVLEQEIVNSPLASAEIRNKTYTMLFDMLVLAKTHEESLLKRGFTKEQIEENGYKSTPVFGFKSLTKKLIEAGCTVKGVPGFYQEKSGEWTVHFSKKSSGFLVPIRDIDGLIAGAQIRLDTPRDGGKYIWLSSVNYHMGTSSGSPVHLAGDMESKTVFVTEGPLKGDLAHALSGRTFLCVPGVNQYANLMPALKQMKMLGTTTVYEAYDMDKLLKPYCKGDYNDQCIHCDNYKKDWKNTRISCERKTLKRKNIQNGRSRLAEICDELGILGKSLLWDTDPDGKWAENIKGVDDYLFSLKQNK